MGYDNLRRKLGVSNSFSESVFDNFENNAPEESNIGDDYEYQQANSDYNSELNEIRASNEKLYLHISKLNIYQQQAIFDFSNNTVLSAMVGSGKTTVIVYKILYLYLIKNVPLDKIMVLTFTNKAAKEVQIRLSEFLSVDIFSDGNKFRYFGTFHSVARQLIKEHNLLSELKFTSEFTILDKNDAENVVNQIILENSLNIKYQNKILKRIETYIKSKVVLMGNMKSSDDLIELLRLLRIYKQTNNLLDFNDLLSVLIFLLKKQNTSSFDWIIVDEFQDCNKDQIEILSLIRNKNSKEILVGDPNQSIYAWRGSSPLLIDEYIKENKSVLMNLPLNYRTDENILSACSFLLMNKDSIKATKHKGSPIHIREHYDDVQEAFYLAAKFKHMQAKGVDLSDIAILFRTRNQISVFATIFKQENITCNVIQKLELKDVNVQYWFFKLLACGLNNNRLDTLIEVFTNKEFSCLNLNKTLINKLNSTDDKINTIKAIIESKKNIDNIFIPLVDKIKGFKEYLNSLQSANDIDFVSYFDIPNYINPTSALYKENLKLVFSCQEEIKNYILKNKHSDNITMLNLCLDKISLEGNFNINDNTQADTGVNLMSIHASKGLEFEYVFISGANDGLIPLKRNNSGTDHLKEEKRLLFVALTRAKTHLEVSFHTQPKAWNAEEGLSYFFNVIPSDLLIWNKEVENKNILDENIFCINDKLIHAKYGIAKVIACNSNELVCEFEKYGTKKFNTKMAVTVLKKYSDK